jgi:hypothetical protein
LQKVSQNTVLLRKIFPRVIICRFVTGRGGKNERELAENPLICLDANYLIAGTSDERPESAHLLRWIGEGETFCPPQSTFKPSPPL